MKQIASTIVRLFITIFVLLYSILCTDIYAYIAKEWNFHGITIIKRSDWIQDQSLIFKKNTPTNQTDTESDEEDSLKTPTK